MPFSYEDKRLAQRWSMHSWCIHWPWLKRIHICWSQTC